MLEERTGRFSWGERKFKVTQGYFWDDTGLKILKICRN